MSELSTDVVDPSAEHVPVEPMVPEELVVGRNAKLFGAVTLLAGTVAVAYAWRGAQGSALGWVVVAVLAAVALAHLRAWVDARKPLLVADPRGVRIRLGRAWTGFAWHELDEVSVRPRRNLLTDGSLLVRPMAGEAYQVRLGATSTASGDDVAPVLSALADGRATVVAPQASVRRVADNEVRPAPPAVLMAEEAPEGSAPPDPSLSQPRSEALLDRDARQAVGASPARPETQTPEARRVRWRRHRGGVAAPVEGEAAGGPPEPAATAPEQTPHPTTAEPAPSRADVPEDVPQQEPTSAGPDPVSPPVGAPVAASVSDLPDPAPTGRRRKRSLRPVVAAADTRPPGPRRAVRADVRRAGALNQGALALSPAAAGRAGDELPEVTELRGTQGRVGLVIEHVADPQPAQVTPYSEPASAQSPRPVEPVIGSQLTQARTRLRVSVDQLAERTRIRPHVIEAIEADDFAACGGDFYARGHLRRLASVLGLDPDPWLATYDERYASGPIAASAVFSAELANGPGAAMRSTRGGPNWTALLGVVVALLVLWGVARWVTGAQPAPAQPGTSAAAVSAPGGREDPDRFSGLGAAPRTVSITTTTDTFVAVRAADGKRIWRGPLQAGEARRWSVTGPVTVRARDAAAVTAQLGNEDPVPIGPRDDPGKITLGGG